MRILKESTLGVVIDIQEKLFPHILDNQKLLENCNKLIEGLKVLQIPLLVTEQYTKGLGKTIEPIKTLLSDSYQPIEKISFSCCGSEDFVNSIKNSSTKNILLFGIETHVCVLQTALDLLENGFQPILIEDCVSSRKENDKKIAVERMKNEGCIITTYESILFELCKVAGSEQFKAISRIVK